MGGMTTYKKGWVKYERKIEVGGRIDMSGGLPCKGKCKTCDRVQQ
jgi:hypothetical protein